MKNWVSKNYKLLIIGAFLVPIFTVALVSISHVTKWYGISNPVSWAIYLSIGIEIAALSTLAAISADMGKKVYFPFGLVTLIQFIGNIYFAYSFIDIDSKSFKDWVDLVSPMVEFMGVDNTDLIGHKRFLAFFAGGMLPIISLSFLHMLVKFTEEDRKKSSTVEPVIDIEKISRDAAIIEAEREKTEKYTPTDEELEKIEKVITKIQNNNDNSHSEKEVEHEGKNNSVNSKTENESQKFSTTQPTENVESEKFSTIENKNENNFQNEDGWTEGMEKKYRNEQVPESFATSKEVIEHGIDKTEENVQEPINNENVLESTQIIEGDEKKN